MPTLLQSWLQNLTEFEAQGRKLAIIAGPGGNAGVISAGAIAALLQTSSLLPNAHYIGTSVGAFNLLYLLANGNHEAATIFGRYYCDNRFINPTRLLLGKPVLNLNFVLNNVTEYLVPINYEAASTTPFTISALTTNAEGSIALLPLTNTSKQAVQRALHNTAAMPLIGRTHAVEQLDGWDGWLVEHQLLQHLQQQGITDVVWLLNRPQTPYHQLPKSVRFLGTYIIRKLKRHNPQLARMVQQRLAAGDFLQSPPPHLNLEVIQPPVLLAPNSRNPAHIFHALGTSYRRMAEYLGQPNLPYPAEWQPWQHHMPK